MQVDKQGAAAGRCVGDVMVVEGAQGIPPLSLRCALAPSSVQAYSFYVPWFNVA